MGNAKPRKQPSSPPTRTNTRTGLTETCRAWSRAWSGTGEYETTSPSPPSRISRVAAAAVLPRSKMPSISMARRPRVYTGSGQALAGSASADRSIVSFISVIDTAGKFFTNSRNRVKKSPNDPTVIAASTHVGW